MGMDPEARLAYGFKLGDSEQFNLAEATGEYGALAVDWYDPEKEGGFAEQLWNRLFALIPEPPEVQYDWHREEAARKYWNVDLVYSGTYEFSGYILTVTGEHTAGSYASVEWSNSMPLDLDGMTADPVRFHWDERLGAALKALGLTPTQARAQWLVFPFYG
jgi:hypothetical protein